MKSSLRLLRRRALPRPDHPGHRRHDEDHRPHRRADPRAAAGGERRRARADPGLRAEGGAGMRRLGRLLGHHRQPGARRRRRTCWSASAAPRSSPRRRRSTAPSSCCCAARSARRWREKLIERIRWWERYTAINGGSMDNNPSPGQQGRRADDDPGEVARRRGQGRLDAADRRLPVRRAGDDAGLRLHGHARLRPGRHHRPDRRRGAGGGLHHRARLGLRLEAGADDQGRDQRPALRADARRHGHQLRRHREPGRDDPGEGRARSSRRSCASPRARRPRARRSASATTSSCPGRSAR